MNSIRDHPFGSQNAATCSAVGLRTLVATAKGLGLEAAPKFEDVKMKVEAEASRLNPQIEAAIEKYNAQEKDPAKKLDLVPVTIDWSCGGIRGATHPRQSAPDRSARPSPCFPTGYPRRGTICRAAARRSW